MKRIILCLMALAIAPILHADDTSPFHFEFAELAPGVWVGVRPESARPPVMGNATFVISEAGVVVFDGGGMPAMADQVIAKPK